MIFYGDNLITTSLFFTMEPGFYLYWPILQHYQFSYDTQVRLILLLDFSLTNFSPYINALITIETINLSTIPQIQFVSNFLICHQLFKKMRKILQYSFAIKKNKISASSGDSGTKAVSQTSAHQWEVKGPMETLLSSLAACEVATIKALTKKTDFKVHQIDFTRMQTDYDLNLFMKGGQSNKIKKIVIEAEVKTNGSQEQLDELKKKTLHHCPIYQTLKAGGVQIQDSWKNINNSV